MLERYHKMLIGLLVVQVVLIVAVFARGGDNGALGTHLLLPGFDAAKVTRIQIASGDGKSVDLVKKGDKWTVASAFDFPVDDARVADLLTPVAKLAAEEPIATSASRHKQLKVAADDFDRSIALTADNKTATILLGGPAGSRRNAMRFSNDDDVYAVTLSPNLAGAEPRDWIDTGYVKVTVSEVTKLTVQRATGGTLELTREDNNKPWALSIDGAPVTEPLDTAAIDRLVMASCAIDASAPADPKRDASAPAATLTIVTKAGPVVVDALADAGGYWVKQRDLPRAIVADKMRLDDAIAVTKDKLIKKAAPATPPGPGSAAGSGAGMQSLPPDVQEQLMRQLQQQGGAP